MGQTSFSNKKQNKEHSSQKAVHYYWSTKPATDWRSYLHNTSSYEPVGSNLESLFCYNLQISSHLLLSGLQEMYQHKVYVGVTIERASFEISHVGR